MFYLTKLILGEGQDEPNHDPYLEKPKEGRGIGDFLKGTAFDLNFMGMFFMRILKIVLGLAFSVVITMILFVKPGILVNWTMLNYYRVA